jgi:hypothetical protein
MTDDSMRRSRYSSTEDAVLRVVRLEEQFRALVQRMDAHIADSARLHSEVGALLQKLDARADRNDLMLARLMTGVSIAVVVAQLIAPYILHALGAPQS